MTHDILQSDIDLACKLVDAGRTPIEIVAALTSRGIDSNRAAQLVADLQSGKTVEPDRPIKITLSPAERETAHQPRGTHRTDLPDTPSAHSRSRWLKGDGFPWFTIIAIITAAVCVAAFVHLSRKSHRSNSVQETAPALDKSFSGSNARTRPALNAKAILLEVQQEGMRLRGVSITRESFLTHVFNVLGAPARTNQVEKVDQVIYAYDAFGLLVYSPKDSGHYSIVLDFDASAGAAGTKNPFVGTFKINGQNVGSRTDTASLGLIKGLALQAPKSASGIFHAQCGSLELVFGYLKSPEHLSLVEIDFK